MMTVWIGTSARWAISVTPGRKASSGRCYRAGAFRKEHELAALLEIGDRPADHVARGVVGDVAGQPCARAQEDVVHERSLHDADAARQAGHDEHRIHHARVIGGDDEAARLVAQRVEGAGLDAHQAARRRASPVGPVAIGSAGPADPAATGLGQQGLEHECNEAPGQRHELRATPAAPGARAGAAPARARRGSQPYSSTSTFCCEVPSTQATAMPAPKPEWRSTSGLSAKTAPRRLS